VWWDTLVILAGRRLRQEDCEFQANQSYAGKLCHKTGRKKKKREREKVGKGREGGRNGRREGKKKERKERKKDSKLC
jgi:hypothetical protein